MSFLTPLKAGLLGLLLFTAGHSASAQATSPAAPAGPALAQLLAYPATAPLDVKVIGTKREAGVVVDDITFAAAAGGAPIAAYLVRPEGVVKGAAGILFVHWFEPSSATSNRTQFLDEARELARRGTVSLLVATFWSDPARYKARRWQDDYQNSVNQAKDLRRALDVLLAQPGVDAQRIGCIGHDYGAMFSSLAVAADTRVKAFVSIAGTARFADWYTFGSASGRPAGEALTAFRAQLAPLDPINVLPQSKAAVFFQFGEADHYTPRADFVALYLAAAAPKRIATYPTDHPMLLPIIRHDRLAWISEQLGLPAAAVTAR
jgi:dienelactone hydrolase